MEYFQSEPFIRIMDIGCPETPQPLLLLKLHSNNFIYLKFLFVILRTCKEWSFNQGAESLKDSETIFFSDQKYFRLRTKHFHSANLFDKLILVGFKNFFDVFLNNFYIK